MAMRLGFIMALGEMTLCLILDCGAAIFHDLTLTMLSKH